MDTYLAHASTGLAVRAAQRQGAAYPTGETAYYAAYAADWPCKGLIAGLVRLVTGIARIRLGRTGYATRLTHA